MLVSVPFAKLLARKAITAGYSAVSDSYQRHIRQSGLLRLGCGDVAQGTLDRQIIDALPRYVDILFLKMNFISEYYLVN
jgi:hypothetical protein